MTIVKNRKKWVLEDLFNLPENESGDLEYKSSLISMDNLLNKISIAASAFWNSGGGVLIIGVDDKGKVDGGVTNKVGKQKIRDWIDNAVKLTELAGEYKVWVINVGEAKDKVVVVIEFFKSFNAPHMAYDNKYYIRAGTHSIGANHFQVETLRAMRQFEKPDLRGLIKVIPKTPNSIQLLIIAVNDAVALDVQVNIFPEPISFNSLGSNRLPLEIPIINKDNPFEINIYSYTYGLSVVNMPITLVIKFKDVLGNKYNLKQEITPLKY